MAVGRGAAECRRESASRWVHRLWRAMVSVSWRRGSNGDHGRARRHPACGYHSAYRLIAACLGRLRGVGSGAHLPTALHAGRSGSGHGNLRYSGYRRLCAHRKPVGANAILLDLELADLPRDRRHSRARIGAIASIVSDCRGLNAKKHPLTRAGAIGFHSHASGASAKGEDNGDDQADDEEYPGDVGGCARDARKSEYGGNNRDYEENKCPVQHGVLSLL